MSGTDAVRRSFDAIASAYARDFADELARKPADRALLDAFAARLPEAGVVLDLGCGAAAHVGAYVASRGPGRRVAGLDLSVGGLRVARGREAAMPLVAGDLARLPFRDRSVAGLVCFYALIYGSSAHLAGCLRELARVARSRAPLLAAVHGGATPQRFDTYDGIPIDVTLVPRDPIALAGLAEEAGFVVDEVQVREPLASEHPTPRIYLTARAR